MHTLPLIHKENAAASNTDLIHQLQQKIRVRHMEGRSNLQSHRENTWIFWSGVWRWKMLHLREIGSRHNSYINMILRQAAFSILTAYFLGRQMSDVSMGVTGREWLTVGSSFAGCYEGRRSLFSQRGLRWREDMLSDGERFSDWKRFFRGGKYFEKRLWKKMRLGLWRGTSQAGYTPQGSASGWHNFLSEWKSDRISFSDVQYWSTA